MNQKIFYIRDSESRILELDPRGHFVSDHLAETDTTDDWFSEAFTPADPKAAAAKTKYLGTLASALREGVSLAAFLDRVRGYSAWARQQQGLAPTQIPHVRPAMTTRLPPAADADLRKIAIQFHDFSVPCFFEGCEQLRAELARQLEEAGADCSDCDRNRIMTQFSRLAVAALRRNSPDHDLS